MKQLMLTIEGIQDLPHGVIVPFRGKTKQKQYFALLKTNPNDWNSVEIYLSDVSEGIDGDTTSTVVLEQIPVSSVEFVGKMVYIYTSKGKFVVPPPLDFKPITFNGDSVDIF